MASKGIGYRDAQQIRQSIQEIASTSFQVVRGVAVSSGDSKSGYADVSVGGSTIKARIPNNTEINSGDAIVMTVPGGDAVPFIVGSFHTKDSGGRSKPNPRIFTSSRVPTGDDDVVVGYKVGDEWYYDGIGYKCVDTSVGAAVWSEIGGSAGSGTVTSVGLSMPSTFTVSGSPITGSGTITVTLANQTVNRFFAGPASGGAAAPTWRAIVQGDIPLYSIDRNRMANMSALTVMGRYSNSVGVPQEIVSGANDRFLARRSNSLTFDVLAASDIPSLAASKITSGTFDNARINFAAPSAIGGTTPAAGTFTSLAATSEAVVRGAAGTARTLFFQTGTTNRWVVFGNAAAEGGSDSGTDFAIGYYADGGSWKGTPLQIFRSSGVVNITTDLELDGAFNHDGSTIGFYGTTPASKPTVFGSRGANEALYELLNALANLGLITNSTTG